MPRVRVPNPELLVDAGEGDEESVVRGDISGNFLSTSNGSYQVGRVSGKVKILTHSGEIHLASAGDGAASPLSQDGALRSYAAAAAAASGLAAGAQRLAGTVRVRLPGSADLDVASVFALEDCPGGAGDGDYGAVEVRHRFDRQHGFVTELLGAGL